MNEIYIARPDVETLQKDAVGFLKENGLVQCVDVASHERALNVIAACKTREKRITEAFEPSRAALESAKKEILKLRDGLTAPFALLRQSQSRECDAYEAEQDRLAREEKARLEKQALERQQEDAVLDAAACTEVGDEAGAQAILEAPVITPVIHVAPNVAAVEGVGKSTRFSAEVTDPEMLVLWVADEVRAGRKAALSYVMANQPNLNRAATMQRENLSIPGVRPVASTIRRVSGVGQ